jgi:hypothetical protein
MEVGLMEQGNQMHTIPPVQSAAPVGPVLQGIASGGKGGFAQLDGQSLQEGGNRPDCGKDHFDAVHGCMPCIADLKGNPVKEFHGIYKGGKIIFSGSVSALRFCCGLQTKCPLEVLIIPAQGRPAA